MELVIKRVFKVIVITIALCSLCFVANAENPTSTAQTESVKRIGGDFKVAKISPLSKLGFRVLFRSTSNTAPVQFLQLDAPHLHFGLKEGQVLRLTAEVSGKIKSGYKVDQMVLFVPSNGQTNPIWLTSINSKPVAIPPGRLIELHAPRSDYTVF
jgi:hypothetical protein